MHRRQGCAAFALAFLVVKLFAPGVAFSQSLEVATWKDIRPDARISLLMICRLELWMTTQVAVEACGLPRKPVDDAIDRAVQSLEDFIVAHSARPFQAGTFEDMRRFVGASARKTLGTVCAGPGFDKGIFRDTTPELVDADVKGVLATSPSQDWSSGCF